MEELAEQETAQALAALEELAEGQETPVVQVEDITQLLAQAEQVGCWS